MRTRMIPARHVITLCDYATTFLAITLRAKWPTMQTTASIRDS